MNFQNIQDTPDLAHLHTKEKKTSSKFNILTLFLVLSLIVVVCLAGFLFYQYQKIKKQLISPNQISQSEKATILAHLKKIAVVPNEEPTFAKVDDKAQLGGQAFFKNANDGDYVLVFKDGGIAVLYRPSTQQVVNMNQVSFDNQAVVPTPSPAVQEEASENDLTKTDTDELPKQTEKKAPVISSPNPSATPKDVEP